MEKTGLPPFSASGPDFQDGGGGKSKKSSAKLGKSSPPQTKTVCIQKFDKYGVPHALACFQETHYGTSGDSHQGVQYESMVMQHNEDNVISDDMFDKLLGSSGDDDTKTSSLLGMSTRKRNRRKKVKTTHKKEKEPTNAPPPEIIIETERTTTATKRKKPSKKSSTRKKRTRHGGTV
jgi:hypothetical protein